VSEDLTDGTDLFLAHAHAEIMRERLKTLNTHDDCAPVVDDIQAGYCPACTGGTHSIEDLGRSPYACPGCVAERRERKLGPGVWSHCRECSVFWSVPVHGGFEWRVFAPHPWVEVP
jgi:hypothetical protein